MDQNKKTVGIVMPLGSQQGGAEALLRHLLQHGSGRFRLVCAFFQEGTLVDEAKQLGYCTIVIPATHLNDPRNYVATLRALRRWIKSEKVDLVFSWMPKAHLYAGPASFGLRIKTIWYQHGVPERDPLDRIATRLSADAVLCCSKTSEAYQNRMSPRRRSFVSYPGIVGPGADRVSKLEARRLLGLPEAVPLVSMVARLERWKGIHIFVAAAERIFEAFPDAILAVIGGAHPLDRPFSEELAQAVSRLSRPGQFILAGQKTMAEVSMWQSASDLLVHPVTGVEAFGMAVPEAMAHGKVVIASNEGGPAEIIENSISGVLVDKNDPERLAQAVVDILAHPDQRERLEAGAARRAQDFSAPAFVHRLDDLLAEILA
jgi:glycosyltransferase involved in cell wall biosynthesis